MSKNRISRRDFIKTSAAVSLAGALSGRAFAAGSDKIRIGIVGPGGRGSEAVIDCMRAYDGVELTAIGALTKDHWGTDYGIEKIKGKMERSTISPDRYKVADNIFTGFDAYKKVIESDVDLVLLATPPGFRPLHYKAAVEAGKHVFVEKPVAVDVPGVRSFIETSKLAEQKKLSVVAGTMNRHRRSYIETIKRIHDGAIGEIVGGNCYFIWGTSLKGSRKDVIPQTPEMSDVEWQCHNWYYHTWLSGDFIVEQDVHSLDLMNWAMGTHPVKAIGMGGREVRKWPGTGNIYDHFAVEFEFPNEARITSMCSHIEGTSVRISEHIVGTKGSSNLKDTIKGKNSYVYEGEDSNSYVEEHRALTSSILQGKGLNEGTRVAESTMTAILGRMSAYTGREVSWDWAMKKSIEDLSPPAYEFGDLPVGPIAVPGVTKLS